jgi:microcystin-dependent protein
MGTTPTYGLRYPESSEPANVPVDMQELATDVDTTINNQITPLSARVTTLESQFAGFSPADPGDLKLSARTTPSAGWLLCDGSAVSRTTYSALFAAIGTAYGAGDGTTTFSLPDYRGRTPVGVGVHADVSARGANEGALAANRRPRHRHTVNDPTHAHSINDPSHTHGGAFYRDYAPGGTTGTPTGPGNNAMYGINAATTGIGINGAATGVSVGPQSGAEPVDSAAYQTCNVFIKT